MFNDFVFITSIDKINNALKIHIHCTFPHCFSDCVVSIKTKTHICDIQRHRGSEVCGSELQIQNTNFVRKSISGFATFFLFLFNQQMWQQQHHQQHTYWWSVAKIQMQTKSINRDIKWLTGKWRYMQTILRTCVCVSICDVFVSNRTTTISPTYFVSSLFPITWCYNINAASTYVCVCVSKFICVKKTRTVSQVKLVLAFHFIKEIF